MDPLGFILTIDPLPKLRYSLSVQIICLFEPSSRSPSKPYPKMRLDTGPLKVAWVSATYVRIHGMLANRASMSYEFARSFSVSRV